MSIAIQKTCKDRGQRDNVEKTHHLGSLVVMHLLLLARLPNTARAAPLPRHLEDDFQLDWRAERKACDTVDQAAGALVFSENVLKQLRSGVSDFRLIADISRSGHRHAEPDDPRHFVERSQMLPGNSEDVERRELSSPAPRFHIELCADPPNEFRPVALRRKHPA